MNESVPLAGLVFDQQTAGKSAFTVNGPGKIVLGEKGIATELPSEDGAKNRYTVVAPLELMESQTWWVTNSVGHVRGNELCFAGPISTTKPGVKVTKRGWGDVWLCANLDGPGTLYVRGIGAVQIVR